jgi:hypothetical protein
MRALEFTTELSGKPVLNVPQDIAIQLPKSGAARIIVLTSDDPDDSDWRQSAYQQFMHDDSPEDAVYDKFE